MIYRVYVTDCLKAIAENTAKINGGNVIGSRYYDMVRPPENVAPEKSPDEIISGIKDTLDRMRGKQNG